MPYRDFPNEVAHINENFLFTTLTTEQVKAHSKAAYRHPVSGLPCVLFSLDDRMQYIPFAKDFGPFNLAYTFEACCALYEEQHPGPSGPLCIYTSPDPKMKSNIALMVALYCVIVGHNSASESFRPFAEMEFRPFRDAGNATNDFALSIQDVLYGIEKAIDSELLDFSTFEPKVYRFFETVGNGDLNVLGPFVPFASPVDKLWVLSEVAKKKPTPENRKALEAEQAIARNSPKSKYPNRGFRCVMKVFRDEKVGVVVRLNNDLYDREFFLQAGISHVDMYFDDGSNPTDEIVRAFIWLSEETIEERNMRVAVHCKAGLGRTGVLIGAYFIYKYGFSAQEVIGFMRLVRPGMVVGPQQQYMVANQMKWIGWAAQDAIMRELRISTADQSSIKLHTPPLETAITAPAIEPSGPRYITPVEELKVSSQSRRTISASVRGNAAKAGDAIGQPRKGTGPVQAEGSLEVEARSSQEEEVQYISSRTIYREHTSSSSTTASRGTKRGAGRIPVDSSSSSHALNLDVPTSTLARSTSTASMQSTSTDIDGRAHKRRPAPVLSSSPILARSIATRAYRRHDVEITEISAPVRALSPSRNRVNVSKPIEVPPASEEPKMPAPARASRNGTEMARPSREDLQSYIPVPNVSKRMLLKSRKSPPAEEADILGPAAPEHARTKPSSREGTLARAGHADSKERESAGKSEKAERGKEKKGMSPPRFGARLLSRLGGA